MKSLPARPRWLDDEAEITALLHAVVDRFDSQSSEARTKNIHLSAERFLPSLKRLNENADQQWQLIESLQRLGILHIKPGRRSLLDAPWSSAKLAFPPQAETALRHWLKRPVLTNELATWREMVCRYAHAFPGDIEVLLRRRLVIPDHNDHETLDALARIAHFSSPITLRQLSAALFRGDSKLLDEREEMLRALFPKLSIRQRAIVVAVHLPANIDGVLFIENQESYIAATEGNLPEAQRLALVYAAGFRGSAERIREAGGALLHYNGPGVGEWRSQFEEWWMKQKELTMKAYFFGDLDFSGMQILAALRRRFDAVQAWQPGYGELLTRVLAEGGHTPNAADKQRQIDPERTGCIYADEVLLPAMRTHGFLDQEVMF
ncbi:MAG TPA: hypothetical protein VGE50_02150 [Gammaproteobacteria bacterium]